MAGGAAEVAGGTAEVAGGGRMTRAEGAGLAILAGVSVLASVLVIAGIGYAAGTGQRYAAALAAAGCEPALSPAGLPCTTARQLRSQFDAAMAPASQQLRAEKSAYAATEWHHLGAARIAVRAEVTSERALDSSLAGIKCPPAMAPLVKAVIQASQARARLLARQARSSSLTRLWSYDRRVRSAGLVVQRRMALLRKALAAPPAASPPAASPPAAG